MKKSTKRNAKYLAFIRQLPCVATGSGWEVIAHHVRLGQNGGTGLKPSDYRCIPLTFDAHGELHQHGERSFNMKYNINPDDEMAQNLQSYLLRILSDMESSEQVQLLEELIEVAEESVI